jgi:DNA-binding winged helix-turn-helix (wHTH) protein
VAEKGLWFKLEGGEAVDLMRRRAMRQLLWALVEKRLRAPGEPMALDEMLAAAWPGERIVHRAGTARIYTAIRALRDLGLRDVLVTAGDGYMIAPAVAVETVPAG